MTIVIVEEETAILEHGQFRAGIVRRRLSSLTLRQPGIVLLVRMNPSNEQEM